MRNAARGIEVVDVGEGAASAIVVLRHLLQRARAGHFVGVVALLQTVDGGYVAVTTPMDATRAVGQIEFLKKQIMDAAEDMRGNTDADPGVDK